MEKDKKQKNLLFQRYETTSLKRVGGKGVALSNFGNEWNYKTKVKRSAHKPCILVNKAVPMDEWTNNSDIFIHIYRD